MEISRTQLNETHETISLCPVVAAAFFHLCPATPMVWSLFSVQRSLASLCFPGYWLLREHLQTMFGTSLPCYQFRVHVRMYCSCIPKLLLLKRLIRVCVFCNCSTRSPLKLRHTHVPTEHLSTQFLNDMQAG